MKKASLGHHPDDFHQNALVALPVKFGVVNLLPRPQVQAPVAHRHRDLLTQQLSLEMGIPVVLPRAVVVVFLPLPTVAAVEGCQLLEPRHDVVVQTVLQVVNIARGGDVHRVDQNQTVHDAAFGDDPFDVSGDADDFIALLGVDVQFFHVGGGGSGDKGAHVHGFSLRSKNDWAKSTLHKSSRATPTMRTVTLVLLVAVLALPMASAETYRISGQATYSDNTPVMLRDVFVECRPGNVDCYQYRGASAITDAQGVYLIAIEVDEDEDGTEIYLQLRGENFTHVIDLDTFRNTSEGKMTQNLRLSQDSSGSGFFSGLGCCLVLFGLVFMSTLLRTVSGLATPRGRAAFQGYREPERHDCPVCDESVAQHNLVKHLIFEHDYDPMDAGEAAGLVMRKSWSKDDE